MLGARLSRGETSIRASSFFFQPERPMDTWTYIAKPSREQTIRRIAQRVVIHLGANSHIGADPDMIVRRAFSLAEAFVRGCDSRTTEGSREQQEQVAESPANNC